MVGDTRRAAFFIDKGGVGKTTAAAHTGAALAGTGTEVLLVDLAGKQGDLAKAFGVWDSYRERIEDDDAWPNVTTVFQDEWDAVAERLGGPREAVDALTIETDEGVDLVPAHPGLDSLDADLAAVTDSWSRYSRFGGFLDEYVDPLGYEVVLVDLPGLTSNVTYNGLWAARHVVAPVEMGAFEAGQAARLSEDLRTLSHTFAVGVDLTMLLPNKVDRRTRLADRYLEEYRERYGEIVAPAPVPYSQDVRNAVERGHTLFGLDDPSKTAREAREAFRRNATALIDRLGGFGR